VTDEAQRVAERFARVEAELGDACRAAGRSRSEVTLVAISKKQPVVRLEAAIALGHRHFGENYPQELDRRRQDHPELRWHQVGHVQRNKAKLMVGIELLHSLDGLKLARSLSSQVRTQQAPPLRVLAQVNQAREPQKTGFLLDELPDLFEALPDLPGVSLEGFMTIPPPSEGRRYFAELRQLRDEWAVRSGRALEHLSMGMSQDFAEAVAEGATLVRIGTSLFGERPTG
jgi:hypothetical protein